MFAKTTSRFSFPSTNQRSRTRRNRRPKPIRGEQLENRQLLAVTDLAPFSLAGSSATHSQSNSQQGESEDDGLYSFFVARLDGLSGTIDQQILAGQNQLADAGLTNAKLLRSLGSEGLFLLRTTSEVRPDDLNQDLSRIPGYRYLQGADGNAETGELTRVIKGELKVNPLTFLSQTRADVGPFAPAPGEGTPLTPPTILGSFAGLDANVNPFLLSPPDPILAAGPDHVIEAVNVALRIYSKDGTVLETQLLDEFFAPLGVPSAGDPLVTYDEGAGRWYVAAIDGSELNNILLAVSDTSNPLDGFTEMHRVAVTPPGGLADFPKIGFNADAVILEANEFFTAGGDPRLTAIDKETLLDQDSGTITAYNSTPAFNFRAMVPATMHGAASGADLMYFIQERSYGDGEFVQVVQMTDVLSDSPVFNYYDIDVSDYGFPPSAQQPGGFINTNDTTFLNADWRNGKLVAAHAVGDFSDSDAHAAWYLFDAPDSGSATPTLIQEGRLDPGDGISTYFPTMAITADGTIGMTYMQSSPSQYASMYVTGRSVSAPAGVMREGALVAEGEDFLDGFFRAGDYSGITVDPVDGKTFWAANEYKAADAFWSTSIAHFSLGMSVANTVPANGEIVTTRPVQYVVDFSDPFDPNLINPAGVLVNGHPASAYSTVDNDTIAFTFTSDPVSNEGLQQFDVSAATVYRLSDGDPLLAFSSTFRYDALRMQVNSTFPADGSVATLPLTSVTVNLNEAYDPASASTDDLNVSVGSVVGYELIDADSIKYLLSGIDREGTLFFGLDAGALTDSFGNPSRPYEASATLDFTTTPFPSPMKAVSPLGGLIYETSIPANILPTGDTDSFTIEMDVDRGQTITVIVEPTDKTLRPSVTLTNLDGRVPQNVGAVTAAGPGKDAVIQTVPVPAKLSGPAAPKKYRVTVGGADGTMGGYTVRLVLNAAAELENHDGATNDTRATAQSLENSFVALNTASPKAERGAAIGRVRGGVLPGDAFVGVRSFNFFGGSVVRYDAAGNLVQTISSPEFDRGVVSDVELGPDNVIYVALSTDFSGSVVKGELAKFDLDGNYLGSVILPDDTNIGYLYPFGFDVATDGSLWVPQLNSGDLIHVGPAGERLASYPLGLQPQDATVGADGQIYVSYLDFNTFEGRVLQLDPGTGNVSEFVPFAGFNPVDINATSDGGFWLAQIFDGAVKYDSTGAVSRSVPEFFPLDPQQDPSDNLWIASLFDGVAKYDAAGSFQFRQFTPNGDALGLAVAGIDSTDPLPAVDLVDYYSLELKAGQTATVAVDRLAGLPITVELQNAAGTTLATGVAAGSIDQVIDDFVVTTSGSYYLKVSGNGSDYSLVVTRNATLEIEPNSDLASAQEVISPEAGGSRTVLGYLSQGGAAGSTTVGYFTDYIPFVTEPEGPIIDAGYTPVQILDIAAFDLTTIDVLMVYEPDNFGPSGELLDHLDEIEAWVRGGGVLVTHDRFVTNDFGDPQPNPFVLGSTTTLLDRDFQFDADINVVPPGDNTVVNGPFGTITDTTLDGGTSSSHGFALGDTLPAGALSVLSNGPDLNHSAAFSYPLDNGAVYYSTIPLDFYLAGFFPEAFRQIYAPNVVNYAAGLTKPDTDWYQVQVDGGKTLQLETQTPAGGAGEFVNTLDPQIRVYDSSGKLVASNDNGASDRRNAKLSYRVPNQRGGIYYIEVATARDTGGEYLLSLRNTQVVTPPFEVDSTVPADGTKLFLPPSEITVNFNDQFNVTTVQGSDLKVDGKAGTGVTVVDGDTATFATRYVYEYGGHYYTPTSGPKDWQNAQAEAASLGGNLVTVNSQAEQDFLRRVFFSDAKRYDLYWIGLNDLAEEGTFVWASGQPVTYTNWAPGEPNDFPPGEDAVVINWITDLNNGAWNDFPADQKLTGIIELPARPSGAWLASEGTHTISIPAGAIKDLQGTSISPYSSSFTLDFTPPRIVASSIEEGDILTLPAGDLDYTVKFSEPLQTSLIDIFDFQLYGQLRNLFYYPTSLEIDPSGTELTVTYQNLLDDQYALTLFSNPFSFVDQVGLMLDGEPPVVSGNGIEGGDFFVNFATDAGTQPLPTPLKAVEPLGSLVYQTPSDLLGTITFAGDRDDFTINLDAGQTASIVVNAPRGDFQPTISFYGPSDQELSSATAPAVGEEVYLQTIAVSDSGTYRVEVGSADGLGLYSVRLILNAAIEEEEHGGPSNNSLADAQSLSAAFIDLDAAADRAAVLGTADAVGYAGSAVPFEFTDISGTGMPTLQGVDDDAFFLSDFDLNGFAFPFYGQTYTSLCFSSNGLITFDGCNTEYTNTDLTSSPNEASIAVHWDDLVTFQPPGAVYWEVLGADDTQQLLIQWQDVAYISDSSLSITFQAILSEADGSIRFNYLDLDGSPFQNEGSSATVGIKNAGSQGSDRLLLAYDDGPNTFVGTGQSTRIQVVPATDDYYAVELSAGQTVTVALADLKDTGAQLELLDANGDVAAPGLGGLSSPENLDDLIANYFVPSTGTYYVRVFGNVRHDYNLVVTRDAAFDTEPNDAQDTAQPLAGNQGALGAIVNAAVANLGTNFEGIDFLGSNCGCLPPDTNAAVGHDHVVETVNTQIRVFDKATGSVLLDESLESFFGAFSGGDPYVVYDDVADHWYVTAFNSSYSGLFLAVSNDGNPLNGFLPTYELTDVGGFPDYAKMGFNQDAIFISYNDFGGGGGAAAIASIDKAAALTGTLTYYVSQPQFQFRAMPPAQMHGDTTGGVEWFVSTDGSESGGDTMRVTQMTNYLSDSPVFTYTSLPVAPYQFAQRADQPEGGGVTVFPNTTTTQVQYRNGHLVTAMASATAADGFVYPKGLYYQIDVSSGTPVLLQEGVIDPGPGVAVQMPSVDEDINGNLGLTWIESSSSEYLSMWVGGVGASGNFGASVAAPGGGFFPANFRIGDYSSTVLDPSDGTTFWSANEYIGSDGFDNIWRTYIASFQVDFVADSDWYDVDVADGTVLTLTATVPASGPGQFVNNLIPRIELYDADENLLGSAEGVGAALTTGPLAAGIYSVRLSSVGDVGGEYVLAVTTSSGAAIPLAARAAVTADRALGDINHDGIADSSDLVLAFQAGEYDDGIRGNSSYEEGDWNGDGEFDTSDLVSLLQRGNYVELTPTGLARGATARPSAAVDAIFAAQVNPAGLGLDNLWPSSIADELARNLA